MIEKLKEHDVIDPKTSKVIGKIGCDLREIIDKLNELVDAVNELQLSIKPILEERESEIKVYEEAHDVFNNATDKEPRCPFCNEKLTYAEEIDGGFVMLTCDCPAGVWLFGNDKMWHTISKLKKQLETK